MSKFTPGPWERATDGEANFYGILNSGNGNWLMRIQQNGELSDFEQEANMDLIVAAEDLLRELKSLLKAYEFLYQHTDPEGALAVHVEWVVDADKAIRKAEGK